MQNCGLEGTRDRTGRVGVRDDLGFRLNLFVCCLPGLLFPMGGNLIRRVLGAGRITTQVLCVSRSRNGLCKSDRDTGMRSSAIPAETLFPLL